MTKIRINKKNLVIEELFEICNSKNNFIFHNDLVKQVCVKHRFGNPFDVTKLDAKSKLPKVLVDNNYAIIHLGNGKHKFVQGINILYHKFEPIPKKNQLLWKYKKSLLNNYNSSESNLLSVANNQRILHNFIFGEDKEFEDIDISKRPKTYFPHRTKTSFEYKFKKEKLELKNIQIEVDLTIEFKGEVVVFEGKNGKADNFNIFQLYHPFLYYHKAKISKDLSGSITKINCTFVMREKSKDGDIIKLWAYTFTKPHDITSIKLVKCASYKLHYI